jgi:hypothetical protein
MVLKTLYQDDLREKVNKTLLLDVQCGKWI